MAAAVGRRRLGAVVVVPGNVPKRQPVRDLRVPEEPITHYEVICLHLGGAGQQVGGLRHLLGLVL